jgi:hypothetical protein
MTDETPRPDAAETPAAPEALPAVAGPEAAEPEPAAAPESAAAPPAEPPAAEEPSEEAEPAEVPAQAPALEPEAEAEEKAVKKGPELDRERWLQLARANAEVIRAEIVKLKEHLSREPRPSFAEFWAHAREVTSLFKTFRPMEAKEREALWAEFHAFCEATRTFQEGERRKVREESLKKRALIEEKIAAAQACLSPEAGEEALSRAQALLSEALNLMKTHPAAGAAAEEAPEAETVQKPEMDARLIREDREACWSRWVEVREAVKARRREIRNQVLAALKVRAEGFLENAGGDDPHGVQASIRAFQGEVKEAPLPPSDKERIRTILRAAWKRASERIEALKEERRQKHAEWLARMTEHLARWEVALYKNEDLLGKIRAEVEDLERRIQGAREQSSAERFKGWLEEKRKRLAGVEATHAELSEKIRTVRAKMGKDAPPPVPKPEPEEAPARRPRRERERPEAKPASPPPSAGLNLGDVLQEKLGDALKSLKQNAEG